MTSSTPTAGANVERTLLPLSGDAYVSAAFGNAYEATAERLGFRPSASIVKNPDGDGMLVRTLHPSILRDVIATAEADEKSLGKYRRARERQQRRFAKTFGDAL